ncbi:hypothetical protein EDD16DRAFT_1518434 [Pisolithus croceorrhizus]|nr:hypothetical protein EDD16DRAFT_1518434 [Pisolithus croceorrhizus]
MIAVAQIIYITHDKDIAGECGKLFGVNPIWQAPGLCESQDGGAGRNSWRVLVKANLTFVGSASCNRNDKLLGPAGVNGGKYHSVGLSDERGNHGNRLSPGKTGIASVELGNCKYAPANGGFLRGLRNVPSAFEVVLACRNLADKDSQPLDLKLAASTAEKPIVYKCTHGSNEGKEAFALRFLKARALQSSHIVWSSCVEYVLPWDRVSSDAGVNCYAGIRKGRGYDLEKCARQKCHD